MTSDLSKLDLLVIQIDGLHIGNDLMLVAALGIDADGHKHPLALIEGATENAAVVQALIDNLIERGLDPKVCQLFIIDGAKVVSHGRYIVFQMAEVAIPRQMLQEILRLIAELRLLRRRHRHETSESSCGVGPNATQNGQTDPRTPCRSLLCRKSPYLGSGLLGSPENRYNLPHFRVHPGNPGFDCASIASSLLQFCEQPIHYPKKSRRTFFNYLSV